MHIKPFTNLIRITSLCCALLLFIAVLHAPRDYYWILRTVVSIGAALVIIGNITKPYWVVLFGIVLILFNPLFPIYLYKKGLWIPIDILVGLLFLIEMTIKRPIKGKAEQSKNELKSFNRDRIL